MKCIQFLCANHTAIGCGCTTCHYFNGAELRDVDIKRFAPLVIDDPYQEATDEQRENVKKWFDETMSNRFNHQHDRLIIVSVPHKEDRLGSQT